MNLTRERLEFENRYVYTGINAYLKNQVENYSKIDNSVE